MVKLACSLSRQQNTLTSSSDHKPDHMTTVEAAASGLSTQRAAQSSNRLHSREQTTKMTLVSFLFTAVSSSFTFMHLDFPHCGFSEALTRAESETSSCASRLLIVDEYTVMWEQYYTLALIQSHRRIPIIPARRLSYSTKSTPPHPQIHPVYSKKQCRLLTEDNGPRNNTGELSAFKSVHHHRCEPDAFDVEAFCKTGNWPRERLTTT